ncbi:alkaline phosphatase family protein [Hymenobacter taeanensis]|uniref:Alkaline phosphatase family protein n=1 Tax=Hymenobacter taeanensis TaxID=2735321 RepID=A0A6M6BFN9_9BACT|nr:MULTISPECIES: alkaline phosphatase PafA [Hymenobacter]QJX47086.1 alkaline phosphatase family protein [Hymenobacter taeanensis]UOQ80965.1 alkaline phosphatase family protein [Hymenobacter sp. 5414T-23]
MKKRLSLLLAATLALPAFAQKASKALDRPKLVVGIVVDQMRYDYLYRYWSKYGNGGFRRLLGEGFSYENAHYNYVPTYTGPGHASIYTGTTPSVHGIVGNNWLVREEGKGTYVTEDNTVQSVGGTAAAGQQSPRHMLTSTITDELRLATNFQSKVIGVCIKDRGSILPAGHAANAAYWYDGSNGAFISSTFYQATLPEWVQQFNQKQLAAQYLSKPWETLLPIGQYTESSPDDVAWEGAFRGEAKPVFPHDLPTLSATPITAVKQNMQAEGEKAPATTPRNLDLIRSTPFGNTLTLEFALEALRAEQLGQRGQTDFLALSFSSTDYVGHQFGPNAIETEDTYLRLDRDLERLFQYLDKTVGRKQVLVFLSADHGAAHSPDFLRDKRIPAGSVGPGIMRDSLQRKLVQLHGAGKWVLSYENQQVYLNRPLIEEKKLDLYQMQREVAKLMTGFAGVTRAITAEDLQKSHWESGMLMYLENGYFPKRSGDVMVVLAPGWLESYQYPINKGTTHGSSGNYDTHIPMVFWGWHVKHGESSAPAKITDIAATLARWLHIQEPDGCTGQPLQEVLSQR